ncbi:MAG: hypothetical protein IKJ39_09085 [Lachnospiraceae bacterium]|nr:hypothetical protein [Lachnospiraceae bacterium]
MKEQENKKANILCWISLACAFGPWMLWMVTDKLKDVAAGNSLGDVLGVICNVADALSLFGWLAALILMIYVRIKYPKNVFGKILMVLYIIVIILVILFIIFMYIMCSTFVSGCESCIVELRGCDS